MKRFLQNIFLTILFLFGLGNLTAQDRYAEKEVTMDHDIMYLKKDMHKLSGVVYNEHGEIGEFVDGLRKGLHKEWFRSGNLKDEIMAIGNTGNVIDWIVNGANMNRINVEYAEAFGRLNVPEKHLMLISASHKRSSRF
mgnify:CR=1 FL=1